jgi:tight adherence protein B
MLGIFDSVTALSVLLGTAIGLPVALVGFAVSDYLDNHRYNRRLQAVCGKEERAPGKGAARRSLSRRESTTPKIDRVARRWLPRREALVARLARTGLTISLGQYVMGVLALAILATFGLAVATSLGFLPSLLLGLFLGIALPHFVIGKLGKRRVRRFLLLFPEAIDLMVRALRSGLPISEAIVNAGHEIAEPVGSELRLVEAGMRLGRSLESLLWETAKRIDAQEFRFFVVALSVQRETGGNLAETLANLADVLRSRRQMRAKVRAMASEARATTAILGGLPLLVIGLLELTSPAYLKPMIADYRGIILDVVGVGMFFFGIYVMKKLASFEI